VESTSSNLVITVEAQDQIIIGRLFAAKVLLRLLRLLVSPDVKLL
jgi:hypothetical protein